MLFPTLNFGLFFLGVFFVAWLLAMEPLARWPSLRVLFLVVASYFFYAFWDWRFMGLLLGSTLLNALGGLAVHHLKPRPLRKAALVAAVGLNLAVLGLFKYFNFFTGSLNVLLHSLGVTRELPYLAWALPIGISFFTFHGISYVVDLYRGALARPAPFLHLLLYISFFPQLVAGPIVRASFFLPQIAAKPDPSSIKACRAFLLILGGLFKKVVIANYLATDLVDDAFFDPTRYGTWDLLLAVYGYAMQIYCDFSAYTDIAIGVAALLGYSFPQNFNQPYRALGVQDFWRRWHISLSSWLRDYLYIPLGGNRGSLVKLCRNLMITMTLGGLWHGASWNFAIWGALNGAILCVERITGWEARIESWLAGKAVVWRLGWSAVMFNVWSLLWIPFRAHSFDDFLSVFRRLLSLRLPTEVTMQGPAVCALAFVTIVVCLWDETFDFQSWAARLHPWVKAPAFAAAVVLSLGFSTHGNQPFIYFRF